MADNVLGLLFEIAADPSKAQQAINSFEQSTGTSLKKASDHFDDFGNKTDTLFGKLKSHLVITGDEALEMVRKLGDVVMEAARFGEEIAHAGEKTGMATEQISALKFAGEQMGVNFESLQRGVQIMSRGLSDFASTGSYTAKALHSIGISAKDVHGNFKSVHQLLLEVADRFTAMKDGVEKTSVAMSLFGRSGAEMIPLLNRGAAGIDELESRARQLGLVMSDQDVKAARSLAEEVHAIDGEIHGLELRLSKALFPTLIEFAELLLGSKYEIAECVDALKMYGLSLVAFGVEVVKWATLPLQVIPQVRHAFDAVMDHIAQKMTDLATSQHAQIQGMQADLARLGEAADPPLSKWGKIGTKAVKEYTDALAAQLQRAHDVVDEINTGQLPAYQRIELEYARQIDAANRELAEDKKLYAHKRISLAELEKREREYTQLVETLANERYLKIKAEREKELKELLKQPPKLGLPDFSADFFHSLTGGFKELTAVQREQLPLTISTTNELAKMTQRLREQHQEVEDGNLPAMRKIDLQYERTIDAARREVEVTRQAYQQKKAILADYEAAVQQEAEVEKAAAQAKQDQIVALHQGELAQAAQLAGSVAGLIAGRRAQAAVEAAFEIAEGMKCLAEGTWPPNPAAIIASGDHFVAAAEYAKIAGTSAHHRTASSGSVGASRSGVDHSEYGSRDSGYPPQTLAPGAGAGGRFSSPGSGVVIIRGTTEFENYVASAVNGAVSRGVNVTATSSQRSAPVGH